MSTHSACSPARSATPSNNALLYVKGGAAVTSDRYRVLATATGTELTNDVNETRWGGVVGVGLEYGFTPNWSVGDRIRSHVHAGQTVYLAEQRRHPFAPVGTLFGTDRIRQDVDLVTVRLNYRWGGPVVAKY